MLCLFGDRLIGKTAAFGAADPGSSPGPRANIFLLLTAIVETPQLSASKRLLDPIARLLAGTRKVICP